MDHSVIETVTLYYLQSGLPWWCCGKESTCNAGDAGSIPGSGRSPGGGHGNPLQYSCLENSTDRGAWLAIVQGIRKNHSLTSTPPPPHIYINPTPTLSSQVHLF